MWKDGDKGAILQRDKQSLAIVPHAPCGVVTADDLRTIADVADKYDVPAMKITSAARIALVGIKQEDVDAIWSELGMAPGAAIGTTIRSIKACPGTTYCKKGVRDSLEMGMYLDTKYHNMEVSGKLKLGVSGCNLQCAENCIKDISLVGKKNGWDLLIGGNGGARPRFADVMARNLSDDQAKYYVDRCVTFFKENAKKSDRMRKLIDRMGKKALHDFVFAEEPAGESQLVEGWNDRDSAA